MFLAYRVARIQPAELARGQELAGLFDQFPFNHGEKLPGGVLPKTTSLERLQLTPTNKRSYKQLPMRLFSQLLVQRFGTRTRRSAIAISLTWQHGRPQSCEGSCRRTPCQRSRRGLRRTSLRVLGRGSASQSQSHLPSAASTWAHACTRQLVAPRDILEIQVQKPRSSSRCVFHCMVWAMEHP